MTMEHVLFIDLEKCRECRSCAAPCSYRLHPGNDGIARLRETAEFRIVCRHCGNPPCAASCPADAIERGADGVPERHGFRCVACRSCVHACPFGAILPETIRIEASGCDLCAGRLKENEPPVCVDGCGRGSIRYGDFKPDRDSRFYAAGKRLVVHAIPWREESDS
jgi:Fe-S-cluster-containing dehydrogenase component